jgi:hypothetical protein
VGNSNFFQKVSIISKKHHAIILISWSTLQNDNFDLMINFAKW